MYNLNVHIDLHLTLRYLRQTMTFIYEIIIFLATVALAKGKVKGTYFCILYKNVCQV